MEDWWKRAKSFAEEAAKKSQSLAESARLSDLITETTKKSKDLAVEASKAADQLKLAALKQADHLRSFSDAVAPQISASFANAAAPDIDDELLGVTSDLREFVKGFTVTTFQSFTVQGDDDTDEASSTSNVRKDLNEWQAKHATLVLSTVKEISKLRYELCPRVMKERRFWRIYFTLVNTYVSPYERRYMEEARLKAEQQAKENKLKEAAAAAEKKETTSESDGKSIGSKTSTSSSIQQDLDSFLLGDLEDSDDDGGEDDGQASFSDDFDKIDNLDDEDDEQKLIQ